MGSGKSTVGKILAEKLNLEFIDIDKEIEKQTGLTIPQIFKTYGEQHFRKLERKQIENFVNKQGYVVSTGGGLGANPENMEKMKKSGYVVWLDVSLDEILKRCQNDTNRPLLNQPKDNIEKLYDERKEVYQKSHIHINADGKTPEEIADEIIKRCKSTQV